jgi:hypothetical protein
LGATRQTLAGFRVGFTHKLALPLQFTSPMEAVVGSKPFKRSNLQARLPAGGSGAIRVGHFWAVEKWRNCRKMSLVGHAN